MAGSIGAKKENQQDDILENFCKAVAEDLSLLAVLHDKEPSAELLDSLRKESFPEKGLGFQLQGERGLQSVELLKGALGLLPEQIGNDALDELSADFASIYLNYAIQASPEESVWIDEENLTHQESMFQVRAWYAQYGLGVEDWRVRPDDHLVLQLQFIAHLLDTESSEERLQQAAQFMDEHLLRWILPFAERVAARCDVPYFAGIAMLTAAYCEEFRDVVAGLLDEPRPSPEEIEERMQPKREAEPMEVKFMPGTGPAV